MDFRFRKNTIGEKCDRNGHVVHRIDLFVDGKDNSGGTEAFRGEEVGYISVTYVPSKVWRERYTGDWGMVRWLNDYTGACGFMDIEHIEDEDGCFVGTNETLHKDVEKTVKQLSKYVDQYRNRLSEPEIEEMTKEALEEAFRHYADKIRSEKAEKYETSREFHVDKPRVEFVRVAKPHRRKGYGTALYKRMTEELGRRYGLRLYDGGVQSDEAEATWEHLVTLDWNNAREVPYPNDSTGRTRYELSIKPETKQAA